LFGLPVQAGVAARRRERMRVLVMGAGGLGSYYGAVLARAGHDVAFVARGAHLAAMRERGLEVRSNGRTIFQRPVRAAGSPAEAGAAPELVLFTTKTYDTDDAATALRAILDRRTAVLTFQNGVESVDRLGAILGPERMLAGTSYIAVTVAEPGLVTQTEPPAPRITVGEPDGAVTPRLESIAGAFADAGVEVAVTTDPRRAAWEKFALLSAHATFTSACELPVGDIRPVDEAMALYRTLFGESVAVARAEGVTLPDDYVERMLALIRSMPPGTKSSMQRDVEAGRRVELEQITGSIVRLARRHGVRTPSFDALYAVLKVRALASGGIAQPEEPALRRAS
jgi:2-dehydropantoate 2-reductase